MGTRGLWGFRYRGRYYTRYNHYDSYPEGLGSTLVAEIPTNPEKFAIWLQRLMTIFESGESLNKYIEERLLGEALDGEQRQIRDIVIRFCHDLQLNQYTCSGSPPKNDLFIEWTYVIDMDHMAFTINGTAHLRLDRIPRRQWIDYLAQDSVRTLCLWHRAPAELRVDRHPRTSLSEVDIAGIKTYENLLVTKLVPSDWSSDEAPSAAVAQRLSMKIAEGLIASYYGKLITVRELYHSKFKTFARFGQDLLSAAAPLYATFTTDHDSAIKDAKDCEQYFNDHKKDPSRVVFWFRGCLIFFTDNLSAEDKFKSSVGRLYSHVQKTRTDCCTAILCSILHVAVAVISKEGISHSDVYPIVAGYGQDIVGFKEGLKLISHFLRPHCLESSPGLTSRLPLDILIRIMDVADPACVDSLGKVSKALRLEWTKRPSLGPFQVFGANDEYYLARYENGAVLELELSFRGCLQIYTDDEDEDTGKQDSLIKIYQSANRKSQRFFPQFTLADSPRSQSL